MKNICCCIAVCLDVERVTTAVQLYSRAVRFTLLAGGDNLGCGSRPLPFELN